MTLQRQQALRDLPIDLLRELRSDHAGETGAVYIYRGILAVSRDAEVRAFAEHHLATELEHLDFFERHLPIGWWSRAAPVWRVAGWVLGALPALFGPRAVFRTISAVEHFVDGHYAAQIDALQGLPGYRWLRVHLQRFRDDEIAHRDDAAGRLGAPGPMGRLWSSVVGAGSAGGVLLARRI